MTDDFATREASMIKMKMYGALLFEPALYRGRFISAIFVISWTFPRTSLLRDSRSSVLAVA